VGILDKIRGEFIDIIEWLDSTNDTLVYRFPRYENEIKYGAKLVVREGQVAVFVNEGQIADVYQPGTYTLETQNMPVLTTLKGWKYGFHSPFKAEVYFASTRNFTDQKWGTKNPVMMRDPEFGPIRLRAFGTYALRVGDAAKLIKEITGTDHHFTTDKVTEQLRDIIITRFTDTLAESKIPALDLAAQYDELSDAVKAKISSEYGEYGLELSKFLIENISFPPEVEAAIDKRSSMGVIGNLNNYMQYQSAKSIEDAANNPGGTAGEGIGLGMGFAMANQMANAFNQPQNRQQQPSPQQAPPPPPIPGSAQYFVAVDGQQAGPYGEQTLQQMIGLGQLTPDTLIWTQGMAQWAKASTVPDVAKLFPQGPPPIPGA